MEFFRWLRWLWQGMETWQRWMLLACLLVLTSILYPAPYNWYAMTAGQVIMLGFMGKWAIVDTFNRSWAKYKQDRNSLLTTIKNSDKE